MKMTSNRYSRNTTTRIYYYAWVGKKVSKRQLFSQKEITQQNSALWHYINSGSGISVPLLPLLEEVHGKLNIAQQLSDRKGKR